MMKYVPNLIPDKSKGTINFDFKPERQKPVSLIANIFLTLIAAMFLVAGITALFFQIGLGLTLLLIGFLFLPQLQHGIEEKLRFKFTWKIKVVAQSMLVAVAIPLSFQLNEQLQQQRAEELAQQARIAAAEAEEVRAFERKEKLREDSLNFFLTKADREWKSKKYRTASASLTQALRFSKDQYSLIQKRADCYRLANQFSLAIEDYSSLISASVEPGINYYNRAVCLHKTGKKGEAVADLKQAIELGNTAAKKLHEQLNPLKRRVAYYVTRCCDGTSSNAKGRGACSHHGGVCNWNDPVYQEYRDY